MRDRLLLLAGVILVLSTSCSNQKIKEVKIGNQVWMNKNLSVTHFSNGDPILEAQSKEEWAIANANKTPAWCYYDEDDRNEEKYGKLYNWYALADLSDIAPEGWRVPERYDCEVLFNYLGGVEFAGKKLKSKVGWKLGDEGTNESGFSHLPCGYRNVKGDFRFMNKNGGWATIDEDGEENSWGVVNRGKQSRITFLSTSKTDGISVRLIKKTIKD